MNLFCVIDVNSPPVELKRTKGSFTYSFNVKERLPGFLLIFSQGKWLDSQEDLCLEANLFVNNKCQELGFINKTNKSIAKEVHLDSLPKISRARLEVKPVNKCSSKASDEKYKVTKGDSMNIVPKEEIETESTDKTKINNSSKMKKSAPCNQQKIVLPEKMSLRRKRNLKEVENLRDPKELETSCNENGITKEVKKAGCKSSNEVTQKESQVQDLHMKEIKENVPKIKSSNIVGKARSVRNRKDQQNNEKEKFTKEQKSNDLKSDGPKNVLKIKAGRRNKTTTEKECKEELKEKKSSEILDNKNSLKKSKGKKQTQSTAKNCNKDLKQRSLEISKSNNTVKENGKKKKELSSVEKEVKIQKKLPEKKQIQTKKDIQKKTSSISKVVKLTLVKNAAKGKTLLNKKGPTKSKISKDLVKTKQTTLQFNALKLSSKTKENSILKESGTPSKKRKLSVSFGVQSVENKPEEPQSPNDVKESKINLDNSPKRKKTETDVDSETPLKDTEALMKMPSSEKDIEYKRDQKENTTENLNTPHMKISCKTPSPPKPPQKNKNKRVSFEVTPDSGSTPKKRSPKRVRTLKNEFAKSPLLKESNAKYPAMCKDVTDRSCQDRKSVV